MDFLQKLPSLPLGRRDFDVATEMAEQDESAREAQRNLLIAIVVIAALALLAAISGRAAAATLLFGTMAILAVALVAVTLVRRSIHRNFGDQRRPTRHT